MAQIAESTGPGAAAPDLAVDLPKTVDGKTISKGFRLYILLTLAATYGLNMADRGVLGILVPPIKKEFQLHDWQIGILSGPIFAIVYAVASMPLSTLADQRNRRNLVASTLLIFSSATVFCGFATSYLQLAIGRFLTGSVESATVPTANSLIADLYPPGQRVSAASVFTSGGSAGAILSGLVGGMVAHHYGWREAFIVTGLPGVLVAFLIYFTVREPQRVLSAEIAARRPTVPLSEVLKHLGRQPAFFWLVAADAFLMFHSRGAGAFTSLFLVQTHGLNLQQLGFLNLAVGLGSIVVTLTIGKLTDKLGNRDIRWFVYSPAILSTLGLPFLMTLLLAQNKWVALGVGSTGSLLSMAVVAPIIATTHALVPNVMRGRALAFLVLIATLIGMGLGPPIVGAMSDALKSQLGESEALRWSLVIMTIPNILGILCFLRCARTLKADVARARAMDGLESPA